MPLWAVSMSAFRQRPPGTPVQLKHAAGYSLAANEAEATGQALIRAKELMPELLGWIAHSVTVGPIPEHDIRAALAGDAPGRED